MSTLTYRDVGVAPGEGLLGGLLGWVNRTGPLRPCAGRPLLPNGYFANVVRLTDDLGLAICTDGVGSKVLVAEMLGKYDTIGIDCVAMNVNDLLCVGAEPVALVDYLATSHADAGVLEAIGRGLYEGARQAAISIPGGELAQLPEIIRGIRPDSGVDLVGTAVGLVHPARIITGDRIQPGDVVLGQHSSGIHSNGLTLARRALFSQGRLAPDEHVALLGRTLGEELLEPTRIYVQGVIALLRSEVEIRGCAHITGDGLLNLARCAAPVGFRLDNLPEPPPIFALIQRIGNIDPAEMYFAFNMGIGFCVVVPEPHAARALTLLEEAGCPSQRIGTVTADPEKKIELVHQCLVGVDGQFRRA
jgi:phosphoribosylformylglycinamidine cyclo-ligase